MGFKKILTRQEDLEQNARDYHDHHLTDLASINRTLFAAIEAIENNNIPYALIGGLAGKELGRPRVTHDIDVFIRPDDAETVLEILERRGFETERRDMHWLYKAWREEVLVDIIFRSSGDIYFDEEVRENVRRIVYNGHHVNTISPEDFIVIKAAAHEEHIPHHWHDALAVLTQGNIDWEYLLKRAKHAPRRVLALLIYGQANDIAVPNGIIQKLYRSLYEHPPYQSDPVIRPYRIVSHTQDDEFVEEAENCPIYIKGRIMEALTSDERIAEHDIKVVVSDTIVVASGEVFTEEQKNAVDEVLKKISPSLEIKNNIQVRTLSAPEGSEAIR